MAYLEHQEITLDMIIKTGLLKAGTKLYAASDNSIIGTLNQDASITLIVNGVEKIFPYPSGAARAVRNISVSGWVFWKVRNGDNLVDLLSYKQHYSELNANM